MSPFGVNTFLSGEVESWKRERTMEMVADAGIHWIRQGFAWSEIEPEEGVYWDSKYQQDAWAKFDEIVDLAEQNGIRIIARLDHTPEWARPTGSDPATPPADVEDFGNFVFEFVSRYRGRIDFIQIWNEPNLAREWGGEIDPEGYVNLLKAASTRARQANPNIVVLSAPLAMTTENSARAQDELTYWQALYDLGVSEWFDIMSANVYGLDDHFAAEPDVSTLNIRRVELLRELAVRNGDQDTAIWFNEFGWNAAPADLPADELIWSRVDERLQADWTADSIEHAASEWEWFGVANIWYFRQVGNIGPERADYYFRMVDLEFTPRDVYGTVKNLSKSMGVAGSGFVGELASPVRPYGSWSVVKHDASSDGRYIVGNAGESIAIQFKGSALDVHLAAGASYGSIDVAIYDGGKTDGRVLGRRQLQIDSRDPSMSISDAILTDPSPDFNGIRTALITVNGNSELAIDGFTVRNRQTYRNLFAGAIVAIVSASGIFILRMRMARQE